MRFYSVHERMTPIGSDPDVVLVPEGFCWMAFFLPFVWAVMQRLWLALGLYVVVMLAVGAAAEFAGLTEAAEGVIGIGLSLLCGLVAQDVRRNALRRSGYREVAVVMAPGLAEAEQRYFENRTAVSTRSREAAGFTSPPVSSFPGFAS